MKHRYTKHRFATLFYSIIATFLLGPILTEAGVSRDIFLLLLGLNIALALYTSRNRILVYGLLPLALVFVLTLGNIWYRHSSIPLTTSPIIVLLSLTAALHTFLHAARSKTVDTECIYAALSAYLLAGVCLGVAYWFVNQLGPGSFYIHGAASVRGIPLTTFLYFSFVTLATIGYGDIVPVSDIARGLSIAEGVMGQLYLAAMLARLVSVYSQNTAAQGVSSYGEEDETGERIKEKRCLETGVGRSSIPISRSRR